MDFEEGRPICIGDPIDSNPFKGGLLGVFPSIYHDKRLLSNGQSEAKEIL